MHLAGRPAMCTAAAVALASAWRSAPAAPLFAAPFLAYDVGRSPAWVGIADLNGDARLDVVTANRGAGTVSTFLDSTELLAHRRDYEAGAAPRHAAFGDLNGDSKRDLAVANA